MALWPVAVATAAWAGDGVKLAQTTRHVPERGPVKGVQIATGLQRVSLILPPDWRIGSSKTEKKVVLQSRDYGATIELRAEQKPQSAEVKDLRQRVQARAANSRIIKEYEWPTPFGKAFAFETEQATGEKLRLQTRSVFLFKEGELLEFNLTARPEKFTRYQKAFENLIASFRNE
jgi:hypothetical protein